MDEKDLAGMMGAAGLFSKVMRHEINMEPVDPVDENHSSRNVNRETNAQPDEPETHLPVGPSIAEPEPPQTRQYRAGHIEQQWWQKWKPRVEIAGLLILAIYAIFTGLMYFANKEAADAAKSAADTAAANIRPWLKIKSITLRPGIGPIKTLMFHWPLTGAKTNPSIQIKVSIENLGHSVAQDIEVEQRLFFGKFTTTGWHDLVTNEEERACRTSKTRPRTSAVSAVVFPSETLDWYGAPAAPIPEDGSAAAVIVCVNYRGAPGTRYQTQAWSGLYEKNYVIIPEGVDAEASLLRLIRDQSGDHAD
jgi:hypothetical protein